MRMNTYKPLYYLKIQILLKDRILGTRFTIEALLAAKDGLRSSRASSRAGGHVCR